MRVGSTDYVLQEGVLRGNEAPPSSGHCESVLCAHRRVSTSPLAPGARRLQQQLTTTTLRRRLGAFASFPPSSRRGLGRFVQQHDDGTQLGASWDVTGVLVDVVTRIWHRHTRIITHYTTHLIAALGNVVSRRGTLFEQHWLILDAPLVTNTLLHFVYYLVHSMTHTHIYNMLLDIHLSVANSIVKRLPPLTVVCVCMYVYIYVQDGYVKKPCHSLAHPLDSGMTPYRH